MPIDGSFNVEPLCAALAAASRKSSRPASRLSIDGLLARSSEARGSGRATSPPNSNVPCITKASSKSCSCDPARPAVAAETRDTAAAVGRCAGGAATPVEAGASASAREACRLPEVVDEDLARGLLGAAATPAAARVSVPKAEVHPLPLLMASAPKTPPAVMAPAHRPLRGDGDEAESAREAALVAEAPARRPLRRVDDEAPPRAAEAEVEDTADATEPANVEAMSSSSLTSRMSVSADASLASVRGRGSTVSFEPLLNRGPVGGGRAGDARPLAAWPVSQRLLEPVDEETNVRLESVKALRCDTSDNAWLVQFEAKLSFRIAKPKASENCASCFESSDNANESAWLKFKLPENSLREALGAIGFHDLST